MKAVRLEGDGCVAVVEVDDPEPSPGEVVVKTAVSALCGSEMSTYRGEGMAQGNSGHEGAGTVEKVGEGVDGLQPGQRVGVSAIAGCGVCGYCEKGQYTWCLERSFYGSMHAEMFVTAANACHLLPDDISWEVGVLISGDGFGVPYHSSTKLEGRDIETVAIFGAGPIGLGNVVMQTHLGRRVIAVDPAPARLEYARGLGAGEAIDPRETEDVTGAIREMTEGLGADVCIEAAGRPETAKQCFQAVGTAGVVLFNGEQPAVELSPSEDFIRRDIWAVGAWYYHFGEFPQMLDLFRSGVPIDSLVTHRFPLEQVDEAYRAMELGQSGKVVLEY